MDKLIEKFKALGDETRFKIFLLLSEKPICVKALANIIGISESAVSQHLKILRNAELIKGEKVGYFTHYIVQQNILKELEGIISELAKDEGNIDSIKEELNINQLDCNQSCRNES